MTFMSLFINAYITQQPKVFGLYSTLSILSIRSSEFISYCTSFVNEVEDLVYMELWVS